MAARKHRLLAHRRKGLHRKHRTLAAHHRKAVHHKHIQKAHRRKSVHHVAAKRHVRRRHVSVAKKHRLTARHGAVHRKAAVRHKKPPAVTYSRKIGNITELAQKRQRTKAFRKVNLKRKQRTFAHLKVKKIRMIKQIG